MDTNSLFTRPLTAQEAVTQELRRAIVAREMKPGQRIHQERLAERLGISRVPIREALRGLESEGQVVNKPNRGYYVAELTLEELKEIYMIRDLLENEMNRKAGANMNETVIVRLEHLATEMEEASERLDVRMFITLNKEFHFTIFEQAERPRFLNMVNILWQSSGAYRSMYLNDADELCQLGTEHRLIIEACKSGDAKELETLSSRHRNRSVMRLGLVLDEDNDDGLETRDPIS